MGGIKLAFTCNGSTTSSNRYHAGEEVSVVASKVKSGEGNFGYNAGAEVYGDMLEMGILDQLKLLFCIAICFHLSPV